MHDKWERKVFRVTGWDDETEVKGYKEWFPDSASVRQIKYEYI